MRSSYKILKIVFGGLPSDFQYFIFFVRILYKIRSKKKHKFFSVIYSQLEKKVQYIIIFLQKKFGRLVFLYYYCCCLLVVKDSQTADVSVKGRSLRKNIEEFQSLVTRRQDVQGSGLAVMNLRCWEGWSMQGGCKDVEAKHIHLLYRL